MAKVIVFDIDGTLSDCEHRKHFIHNEQGSRDWNAFYDAMHFDGLKNESALIWKAFQNDVFYNRFNNHVYLLTGRPEKYRSITMTWLASHALFPHKLYMRPDDDFTPDHELKKKWVEDIGIENILMAFEDRDSCVRMYRSLGIPCLQVAPGDF